MNIGINTRFLLPGVLEGVSRYTWEIISRMAKAHPEDQFFLFFDRKYDKKYLPYNNMHGVVVNPQARHPILWNIWFDWSLPRKFKKHAIDVFLSPDGFCSLRSETPTVLVTHDLAFEHFNNHHYKSHYRYYQTKVHLFHEKAQHIIAVSQSTKDDIIKHYHLPDNKISIAGNSTSISKADMPYPSLTDKQYFLYVGSMHPRKNVLRLIKAFELYKENSAKETKLVLVGRLAWRSEEIKQALATSKYKNDIIHLSVTADELPSVITFAQALVYPSLFEGFGIPILEGWACDTPVITSNCSSMKEVGGDAALLINPESIEEICHAMIKIEQDAKLADTLVKRGQARLKLYDWDESSDKVYRSIKKVYEQKNI